MIRSLVILFIFLFSNYFSYSQEKKRVEAYKLNSDIRIDGRLSESVWHLAPKAVDFFQYSPYNGVDPTESTEVSFVYDNGALYVGAFLKDSKVGDIATNLSKRDNYDLADYFGVLIDPYNDASTVYGFYVTAAGVQVDVKSTTYYDYQWNAVWESAVHRDSLGWYVEMRIPYSALRFSKRKSQEWGLNIERVLQREREKSTWNFIDINISGDNKQAGTLVGIEGVEPPIRLALIPYVSTYYQNESGDNSSSFKGGMDVKYGINESFTLDMMLIPDFGQVRSDNNVLNLGPYETYYGENREFFKEGVELFNRADLFYSRRIGAMPVDAGDVGNIADERACKVVENPSTTQLINATKISGKTKSGYQVGFLNAVSQRSHAVIEDSITGDKQNITTQLLTNYNVSVIEKTLKDNSYISLINTNLYRPDDGTVANVTGTEVRYEIRKEYALSGVASISQKYDLDNPFGHKYWVDFSRVKGRFRFSLYHTTENPYFNPNDMGYLQSPDERSQRVSLHYAIREPFWKLMNWYNDLHLYYNTMYDFDKFVSTQLHYSTRVTLLNHSSVGLNLNVKPVRGYDYHEPRVGGAKFHNASWQNGGAWLSTDYRKMVALDVNGGAWAGNQYNQSGFWFGFSPRIRLWNRFLTVYDFNSDNDFNSIGYVHKNDAEDTIVFGRRNYRMLQQSISMDYIFNPKASLTLYLRHYWSRVSYKDFWTLENDGSLKPNPTYIENEDINFNAFSIDLAYTWQFAPGSEMSIVWKNNINSHNDEIVKSFRDNMNHTFSDLGRNSISIRILYYLDYMQMKNLLF